MLAFWLALNEVYDFKIKFTSKLKTHPSYRLKKKRKKKNCR